MAIERARRRGAQTGRHDLRLHYPPYKGLQYYRTAERACCQEDWTRSPAHAETVSEPRKYAGGREPYDPCDRAHRYGQQDGRHVFENSRDRQYELVLDRRLSERRIFPAIDIVRSGTRRDDLLLTPDELAAVNTIRRAFNGLSAEQAVTQALDLFSRTRTNGEFVNMVRKIQWGKE